MLEAKLPKNLYLAGKQYNAQLLKLGLKPEGLLWVHDVQEKRFVLWLIWSGVDLFGPFELTKLLFRAYRASALTHEIDPFLVDVRSTRDTLGATVLKLNSKKEGWTFQLAEGSSDEPSYGWHRDWVYRKQKRKPAHQVANDWQIFAERVSKLAA
jgi:hypothetical protein